MTPTLLLCLSLSQGPDTSFLRELNLRLENADLAARLIMRWQVCSDPAGTTLEEMRQQTLDDISQRKQSYLEDIETCEKQGYRDLANTLRKNLSRLEECEIELRQEWSLPSLAPAPRPKP